KKDNYLFSTNAFSRDDVKPEQFINKRVLLDGNQGMLGAVIPPRRDHAYDMPSEYAIYNAKITGWYGQIAIRVKPQFDNNIVESLFNDIKNLQSGSVIISDIQSFADIKRNYEMDHELENRNFVVIAVFLLINIFLGVFGTFWFRTRQNIKEIALRKVTGASDKQIFFRIISEAIILLVIAT
ncbi:FtsX-like permease family protein, partial [uncultured Muribaculum sp.]